MAHPHRSDLVRFEDIFLCRVDDRSPASAWLGHGQAARDRSISNTAASSRHDLAAASEKSQLTAICKPCAGTVTSSIFRDRTTQSDAALPNYPVLDQAAPLCGAVPGCALRRACGPDGPTRRSAPAEAAVSRWLVASSDTWRADRLPRLLRRWSRPAVAAPALASLRPSLVPATGLSLRSSRAARDLSRAEHGGGPLRPVRLPNLWGNILATRDRPVCGSWRRVRWGADRRAALPPGRITQRKEGPDEC